MRKCLRERSVQGNVLREWGGEVMKEPLAHTFLHALPPWVFALLPMGFRSFTPKLRPFMSIRTWDILQYHLVAANVAVSGEEQL